MAITVTHGMGPGIQRFLEALNRDAAQRRELEQRANITEANLRAERNAQFSAQVERGLTGLVQPIAQAYLKKATDQYNIGLGQQQKDAQLAHINQLIDADPSLSDYQREQFRQRATESVLGLQAGSIPQETTPEAAFAQTPAGIRQSSQEFQTANQVREQQFSAAQQERGFQADEELQQQRERQAIARPQAIFSAQQKNLLDQIERQLDDLEVADIYGEASPEEISRETTQLKDKRRRIQNRGLDQAAPSVPQIKFHRDPSGMVVPTIERDGVVEFADPQTVKSWIELQAPLRAAQQGLSWPEIELETKAASEANQRAAKTEEAAVKQKQGEEEAIIKRAIAASTVLRTPAKDDEEAIEATPEQMFEHMRNIDKAAALYKQASEEQGIEPSREPFNQLGDLLTSQVPDDQIDLALQLAKSIGRDKLKLYTTQQLRNLYRAHQRRGEIRDR